MVGQIWLERNCLPHAGEGVLRLEILLQTVLFGFPAQGPSVRLTPEPRFRYSPAVHTDKKLSRGRSR